MDQDADADLLAAVGSAVGHEVSELRAVRRTPLEYDAFFAHRAVTRIEGVAVAGGRTAPWSLIEKRTGGAALAAPYLLDNAVREFDAYTSALLDDLHSGIRAPRAYRTLRDRGGGVTLWLEEVRHDGTRPLDAEPILAAATDLGAMAGRWTGRPLEEPWLFRGWIDHHAQPEAVDASLDTIRRRHPDAVALLGDRITAVERLILAQQRVRAILESLPQTLCHHDAVGANVFRADGRTVLIDWESVGPGLVGADLASLLHGSIRRGDVSADTVLSVRDDALAGYTDAVLTETAAVTADDVRRGFDAAVALRWKLPVDLMAGVEKGELPRRGSAPHEHPDIALGDLLALVDLVLASAARTLD